MEGVPATAAPNAAGSDQAANGNCARCAASEKAKGEMMDQAQVMEILRILASPVATIIAAFAAIIVTYRFSAAQLKVAQTQRDVALEKLKLDFFPKRYQTYQTAKALLEYVSSQGDFTKVDATKIRNWKIELDEARFFFDAKTLAFIDEVIAAAELFLDHLGERAVMNIDDDEKWRSTAEILAKDSNRIRQLYAVCIDRFDDALSFKLLTTNNRP